MLIMKLRLSPDAILNKMTSFLRSASSKTLFSLGFALLALFVLGSAVAIGSFSGPGAPAAKPLPKAIADALSGPQPEGFSARVKFTNNLLPSQGYEGRDPLMSGGSGRLWVSSEGQLRLELQSDSGGGDVEMMADAKQLWLYHAAQNTVYQAQMPAGKEEADLPASLATVEKLLSKLGAKASLSGALPDNIAGRPAYSSQLQPKSSAGLLSAVQVSWDAANGAPLRLAAIARGQKDPAFSFEVTEARFGPVDPAVFEMKPPAEAKVQDLSSPKPGKQKPLRGLEAAQAGASFPLRAPAQLDGLKRSSVVLSPDGRSATARYGRGLGSVTVMESAARAEKPKAEASKTAGLLAVKIGSSDGSVLSTSLGSMVSFEKDQVRFLVIGSVDRNKILAVARAL